MDWLDLSSSELVQRLVHRGCAVDVARSIVNLRDHPKGQEVITDFLLNGVPEWVKS